MEPNLDGEISQLLDRCGGQLEPFLESIFGFLCRNTDFFKLKTDSEAVVGFQPGSAEALLLSVFRRWQRDAPEVHKSDTSQKRASCTPPASSASVADCFNGCDMGHYKWTQTSVDLDVTVPVDASIVRGSQVDVLVKPDCIHIGLKDKSKVYLEGQLFEQVKPSECLWNLIPGTSIHVSLEKRQPKWWLKFLKSDRVELEPSALQIEPAMSELSSSDRAAIEASLCQSLSRK